MLRCPTCNLTFPDNALAFCTEDGTRLVPDAQASNLQPTLQAPPYGNAPQQSAPQQYAPQPQYAPQQQWAQPQARSGGGSKLLIGVLIGLLLAGGAGVGIYFLTKGSGSSPASNRSSSTSPSSSTSSSLTPTEAWEALYDAASRRDVTAMKELLSKYVLDEVTRPRGTMSSDENFSQLREFITSFTSEIGDEKITGDKATVEIRATTGEWVPAIFVKENGSWKFAGFQQHASSITNTNSNKAP
jgi:predicted lipid-binding transport protein (Tim44 family)